MKKTLYVCELDVGAGYGLLFTFYAADTVEAMEHVTSLEAENEARCSSLKTYPNGFKIVTFELPGSIETVEAPE